MRLTNSIHLLFYFTFACFVAQFKAYAEDTVTITINGTVTASTCDININALAFDFDDIVVSKISNGLGSANGKLQGSPNGNQEVTFTCPPDLLLEGRLNGNQYNSTRYIQPTNQPNKGVVFGLSHQAAPATDDTWFEYATSTSANDGWTNLLSSNATGTRTKSGDNVVLIYAYLIQVEDTITATGSLIGSTTIDIRYTN